MSSVDVVSFSRAMGKISSASKRHLLLGNGFSIALYPEIFSYGSLYDNADLDSVPRIQALFAALHTQDFEIVIRHLQDAARVVEVYRPSLVKLAASLREDASFIKDALVKAVARRHPDRPYDIGAEKYAACRAFLSNFDNLHTLNYDVLLYWALMQDEVDTLDLLPDDGFRHPEDDPDQPYVSWQQANKASVHYLHGALHLFDTGTEITKYTWSKTTTPIVEQIRQALDEDKYPLFVAEGSSASKRARILHNAYLHKALRSFESCCASPNNAFVIFGHSLAENDMHILRCIAKGGVTNLLVSLYGDPNSDTNRGIVSNAAKLQEMRLRVRRARPLNVTFYDAQSANVWG